MQRALRLFIHRADSSVRPLLALAPLLQLQISELVPGRSVRDACVPHIWSPRGMQRTCRMIYNVGGATILRLSRRLPAVDRAASTSRTRLPCAPPITSA